MLSMASVRSWISAHRVMLGVALGLLLVDRATKVWALLWLAAHGPWKIARYFWFSYVENTGAAFGLFHNANIPLLVVMLLIIGYIIYSWKEIASYGRLAQWGEILILTGALGNLYDRITLGFVVDFLDFRVWPVFNVADSCITVGAVLIGFSLVCTCKQKREEK